MGSSNYSICTLVGELLLLEEKTMIAFSDDTVFLWTIVVIGNQIEERVIRRRSSYMYGEFLLMDIQTKSNLISYQVLFGHVATMDYSYGRYIIDIHIYLLVRYLGKRVDAVPFYIF